MKYEVHPSFISRMASLLYTPLPKGRSVHRTSDRLHSALQEGVQRRSDRILPFLNPTVLVLPFTLHYTPYPCEARAPFASQGRSVMKPSFFSVKLRNCEAAKLSLWLRNQKNQPYFCLGSAFLRRISLWFILPSYARIRSQARRGQCMGVIETML